METSATTEDVLAARASFAQERMWMLEQMEEGAPTYNVQVGLRFDGACRPDLLRAALDEVVARHEILRTTLEVQDGELMQLIAPPSPVPVSELDISAEPDPEARLGEVSRVELRRPFDAAGEPPLRALLVALGHDRTVLLLTLDHLAADAASMRILHTEVVTAYAALHGGAVPALPEPPIQYADYADWQREWLAGPELGRQIGYWRERLAGSTPLNPAPDAPRAPASLTRPIPEDVIARLDAIGRTRGVPVFTVLLSAFALMLGHGYGREDLVVGTLLSGRTRTEIESLIGFFVNTVAIRADLSGAPAFGEVLGRLGAATMEAYANQDAPYERVVAELKPPRVAGRPPFFDVMLQVVDLERETVRLDDTVISPLVLASEPAPVDLVFAVMREAGGHTGVWDFDASVYSAKTVRDMQERFEALLSAIAAADGVLDADGLASVLGAPGRLAGKEAAPAPSPQTRATAAASPLLDSIARTWAQILQRDTVDADDDFFDLGGHSLAATRLTIRLRAELGFPLPVRVIFDHPVLGEFADAVAERAAAR